MNRLLIANGSFTTLLLSAILSQTENNNDKINNFLLHYFTNATNDRIKSELEFAKFFFKYKKSFNLLNYKNKFTFNLHPLKEDLLHISIDEIYIPINSTTLKWYKKLQQLYPKAKFIFYEEGLMSYIKAIHDKKINHLLIKHTSYYLFYNNKILKLLPPQSTKLKQKHILDSIINYQNSHQILKKDYSRLKKYALVLPQYYFQNNKKKHQQLQKLYIENIAILLNNGYHILFKDHPKSSYSYYPLLTQKFNQDDFTLLNELGTLPVEMIGNLIDVKLVFSVYSTSLFTLPYLFNIPSFTSYKMLENRVNTLSLYPALLGEFTKNHITDIDNQSFNYNILLYLYRKMLTFIYKFF